MSSKSATTEDKITQRIAAAGIRLRFDRVALSLLEGIRGSMAETVPVGQVIAFTITAPIKLPTRTDTALQEWLHRLGAHRLGTTINGNRIRAGRMIDSRGDVPKVIGFVHNPESNADVALDIVEASLRGE